jgi:hypothetical protein
MKTYKNFRNVKQSIKEGKMLEYPFVDEQSEITDAIFKIIKEMGGNAIEINSGQCDDFAFRVKKLVPNVIILNTEYFKELAEDENKKYAKLSVYNYSKKAPKNFNFGQIGHFWLYHDGKFYDSELPNGSIDMFDIPTLQAAIELGGHIH